MNKMNYQLNYFTPNIYTDVLQSKICNNHERNLKIMNDTNVGNHTGITNLEKGQRYERYINKLLNCDNNTKISYLWKDVPNQVLFDAELITNYNVHRLNMKLRKNNNNNNNKDYNDNEQNCNPLHDFGVDIIQITKTNEIIFVQCKDYTNTLVVSNLSGFFLIMLEHRNKKGIIYHTNKLSKNIIIHLPENIKHICKPMNIIQQDNNIIEKSINNQQDKNIMISSCNYKDIELYNYQKDVINVYELYYKKNNKAILSMPCGTGKTIVSCYIAKKYNIVIFIAPLKQFAEQNIKRFKSYDHNRKALLIDSDGTRDLETINKFILENQSIMLSCTYKSCDIIQLLLPFLINPFIIIDEFHNLSKNNIYNENDPLNFIINSENKMLCMSATPSMNLKIMMIVILMKYSVKLYIKWTLKKQ